MTSIYQSVMDPGKNPLLNLPPQRRFQVMTVLSIMWTTIFVTVAGLWFIWGYLVLGHMLIAAGTLITAATFRSARRAVQTSRDYPRPDGTARHDDVWGA